MSQYLVIGTTPTGRYVVSSYSKRDAAEREAELLRSCTEQYQTVEVEKENVTRELPIPADFGARLRKARIERGISRTMLAKAADMGETCIWYVEAGVNRPRASTVVALAQALGVSTDLLLE